MAYIDIKNWESGAVTDWLKGLDNSMYKYINAFTNNDIKGEALLCIRPYELNELGIEKIGHQEIVLEAVEQLRNFYYNMEKENLQYLALQVASTATNLHKLLFYFNESSIETQILNDITHTIAMIKPLVFWLDRSPFQGHLQFNEIRERILQLGLKMATSAQRDRFVENPVHQIRLIAEKLFKLANYIIQDISDPIILQPATLTLVTLKKRESELGFNIMPNHHGMHVITDIKYNSPAHMSGKIEDGDEIIQVNCQTVIGWHYQRVLQQLQESPPDVLMTLKKRPKHTKIYGQIYMKPYRLPSKKRSMPYRLDLTENLPSPRINLVPAQNFSMLLPLPEKSNFCDSDSSSDDIMKPAQPTKMKSIENDMRLYLPKPRGVPQRRYTICGDRDRVSGYTGHVIYRSKVILWHEFSNRMDQDSPSLRDKSVSFGFGLEMTSSRPITCIGIHNDKNGELGNALKGSLPDMKYDKSDRVARNDDSKLTARMATATSAQQLNTESSLQSKHMRNKVVKFRTQDLLVNPTDSIPFVDADDAEEVQRLVPQMTTFQANAQLTLKQSFDESELAEAVNETLIRNHPTHNPDDYLSCVRKPPDIGPRREFQRKNAPPTPPPRPSKAAEFLQKKLDSLKLDRTSIQATNGMDKVQATLTPEDKTRSSARNDVVTDSKSVEPTQVPVKPKMCLPTSPLNLSSNALPSESTPTLTQRKLSLNKSTLDESYEGLELFTPNKTKTLTLKKKNSILAKRRKIALKSLENSDIQGHLFRRTKDKHGVTYWAKLYFVLAETALYGFRDKKSTKAQCLIFLSGFTVSLAKEVHSKPFAYKVYHPKKSFYFAAETQQALSQWMEYIRRATLKGSVSSLDPMLDTNPKTLFSETESSDDDEDGELADDISSISSSSLLKNSLLGSGKSSNSKKRNEATATTPTGAVKHEKYNLGFGSLKKLTKHSLPFTSSKSDKEREEKKKAAKENSDVPVPTAQFRSYRKIPGNAGMQLGTNSLSPSDLVALQKPMATSSPVAASSPGVHFDLESPSRKKSFGPGQSPALPRPHQVHSQQPQQHSANFESFPNMPFVGRQMDSFERPSMFRLAKKKTIPYDYMHASNPNLVEFTFQTSKVLDYSMPKVNPSNTFEAHQSLQGFITLKDLMLQQEAAEGHNMYDKRVNLGVEKNSDHSQKRKKSRSSNVDPNSPGLISSISDADENVPNESNANTSMVKKIQSRCLPKTPDYAQSFKLDDSEIIMARSKEIQKLRDFGYEFLSGDDASKGLTNVTTSNQNVRPLAQPINGKNNGERPAITPKRKGLWMNMTSGSRKIGEERIVVSKGSFKIVSNKNSDEKSQSKKPSAKTNSIEPSNEASGFYSSSGNKSSRHSPVVATEPTGFKLERSQSAATHDHFDPTTSTYQNGTDERKGSIERSASYFTKLSFPSNKTAKEKRLLGSPRLHRAIFGRKNSDQIVDHEAFAPVDFGSQRPIAAINTNGNNQAMAHKSVVAEIKPIQLQAEQTNTESSIEYPPVFEPETYSLCDPTTSLTLMRRRTFNKK